jgi:NADPH:quinone reductase-like Zn-dependent oxidoreductase
LAPPIARAATADRQGVPFAEIGAAFAHMEANKHLGKIVVTM